MPHLDTHTSSIQCRTHAQPTPTRSTQPQHNKACVRNMKAYVFNSRHQKSLQKSECCRGTATDSRSFSQASSMAFVSARLTQVDESRWRFKSSCLMYTGACASKACTPTRSGTRTPQSRSPRSLFCNKRQGGMPGLHTAQGTHDPLKLCPELGTWCVPSHSKSPHVSRGFNRSGGAICSRGVLARLSLSECVVHAGRSRWRITASKQACSDRHSTAR